MEKMSLPPLETFTKRSNQSICEGDICCGSSKTAAIEGLFAAVTWKTAAINIVLSICCGHITKPQQLIVFFFY